MTTLYIRGVANWAKVVGDPVDNYAKDGKEWTIDVTPDEDGLKTIKKNRLGSKLKDKDDERGEFIQFKQRQSSVDKKTGKVTEHKPPRIYDIDGEPWDGSKIGNGSVVDVKFNVVDYGSMTGVYLQGIRVMKHVPYDDSGFPPVESDDEFFVKEVIDEGRLEGSTGTLNRSLSKRKTPVTDEDLDEEIPF